MLDPAVGSMSEPLDHDFPFQVNASPVSSTAAQNPAEGHDTLEKLEVCVAIPGPEPSLLDATKVANFHPWPDTAACAAAAPQFHRATSLSVLPLIWLMEASIEPASPFTVTVPPWAKKLSCTPCPMEAERFFPFKLTLSMAVGSRPVEDWNE